MSPNEHVSSGAPSGGDAPRGGPSDQELMLWLDGELDDRRAAEVEAFVLRDARARAVVASLRQAGDVLATHALARAEAKGGDSIADRVMAAIDAEPSRPAVAPVRNLFRTRLAVAVLAAAAGVAFILLPSRGARHLEATSGTPKVPTAIGAFIDVVDFGARPGTIFYVPSEDESTTAVVWLTEDDTSPDDSSHSSGETL